MEDLIHRVVTDIKFKIPCLAHGEFIAENEILLETETRISKIYPPTPRVKGMKYVGEDFWGRETFLDEDEKYYCNVDGSLHYKGRDPEGEPHWPVRKEIIYDYPVVDQELSRFNPYVEKIKEYFQKSETFKLISLNLEIKDMSQVSDESRIVCKMKVGVISKATTAIF